MLRVYIEPHQKLLVITMQSVTSMLGAAQHKAVDSSACIEHKMLIVCDNSALTAGANQTLAPAFVLTEV